MAAAGARDGGRRHRRMLPLSCPRQVPMPLPPSSSPLLSPPLSSPWSPRASQAWWQPPLVHTMPSARHARAVPMPALCPPGGPGSRGPCRRTCGYATRAWGVAHCAACLTPQEWDIPHATRVGHTSCHKSGIYLMPQEWDIPHATRVGHTSSYPLLSPHSISTPHASRSTPLVSLSPPPTFYTSN